MGCNIPPSHIIPAIAARLKYYVEVQRKEAGFDLSVNQSDVLENYKLYQHPKGHVFHQSQRIKKNALDNQMEAALRLYSEKPNREWNQNIQVNQKRKQEVQRKIKKKMSSMTILDSITSNIVYPPRSRYYHSTPSDCEEMSLYLSGISPPDMSHEEFSRLVSSAANLIVATTPGKHERRAIALKTNQLSSLRWKNNQYSVPHCQKYRINSSLKTKGDHSRHSLWLKIPSTFQESNSNTGSSHGEPAYTSCDGDVDVGLKVSRTSAETNKTKVEDANYEITVRTGSSPQLNTEPVLVIILIGENGRTKKLRLHKSSTNPVPFRTGQIDIFNVKAKDTGKLTHIIIEVNQKGKDCRFYCRDIVVKKRKTTDEIHLFPCNGWLSSVQTTLHRLVDPKSRIAADHVTKGPPQGLQKTRSIKKMFKSSAVDSKSSSDYKSQMVMKRAERRTETTKKDGIDRIKSRFSPEFGTKSEPQTTEVYKFRDTGSRMLPSSPEEEKILSNVKSGSNEISSYEISMGMNLQDSDVKENPTTDKYSLDERSNKQDRKEKHIKQDVYLQIQNNIKGNVMSEYRTGSPLGYVYFSHEKNKTSHQIYMEMKPGYNDFKEDLTVATNPVTDKCNGDRIEKYKGQHVDLQIKNDIKEHDLPEYGKASDFAFEVTSTSLSNTESSKHDEVGTSNTNVQVADTTTSMQDDRHGDKASQLFLLQQILLEPINHSKVDSTEPDLRLINNNVGCLERADSQANNYDGSIGDNEVQSSSIGNTHKSEEDGSSYSLSSQVAQMSGLYDGDESSYTSDSTGDEEFLFSDTSLAISLSENESDFMSDSVRSQSEDTSEEDDMKRRIGNPIPKRRKSSRDSSHIFQTALQMIKNKDTARLKDVCQHNFFLLSCTDKEGKTLLHHGATHGSEHICQVLLKSNVGLMNIDKQDIFGKTALHYAVQTGNNKTIKLLLNKGAKSEIPDTKSRTALDLALWKIQEA